MKGYFGRQILISIIIVIIASGVGLTVNFLRPDSLPLVQDWDKTIADRFSKETTEFEMVSLEEMSELFDKAGVLVVDARSKDFYELERIPGAVNLPVESADGQLNSFLNDLVPSIKVVTYCDSVTCDKATKLAVKIRAAGHKNVMIFHGGMMEWIEAGLPVSYGEGD